jgi:hypothetical protein
VVKDNREYNLRKEELGIQARELEMKDRVHKDQLALEYAKLEEQRATRLSPEKMHELNGNPPKLLGSVDGLEGKASSVGLPGLPGTSVISSKLVDCSNENNFSIAQLLSWFIDIF